MIRASIDADDTAALTVEEWGELSDIVTIMMDATCDQKDAEARARSVREMIKSTSTTAGQQTQSTDGQGFLWVLPRGFGLAGFRGRFVVTICLTFDAMAARVPT